MLGLLALPSSGLAGGAAPRPPPGAPDLRSWTPPSSSFPLSTAAVWLRLGWAVPALAFWPTGEREKEHAWQKK